MSDSQSVREQEVVQALRFLNDPRVISSPRQEKETFLVSKGLTQPEIAQALARADAALPFLSPPLPPTEGLWSAVATTAAFLAAMGAGAFLYQLWLNNREPVKQLDPSSELSEVKSAIEELSVKSEIRGNEQTKLLKELVANQVLPVSAERKPASSIFISTPATTTSSPAEVVSIEELARELRLTASLPTVQMILQNLVSYPDDDKYRKVNLANDRFKSKISSGPGFELLKQAGFVLTGEILTFSKTSDMAGVEQVLLSLEQND